MNEHAQHASRSRKLLAGAGVSAGVIAAPYALPFLGLGSELTTAKLLALCSTAPVAGSGLAGFINSGLSTLPGIGATLATGGWISAAASGVIGIGGVLLGNYISKHHDKEGKLPWGKIIKYAALTTSILIALPSILSGLTIGLTYLAAASSSSVAGVTFASNVMGALSGTLGLMSNVNVLTAGAGLAGLLPHLVTCGAALLPAAGALLLDRHQSKPVPTVAQTQHMARVTPAPATAYALSA